ncbi:MAG: DUF6544 family protein [Bacteroidales bacterium]
MKTSFSVSPFRWIKCRFHQEVTAFREDLPKLVGNQEEPDGLPEAVLRHVKACGLVGRPRIEAFEVVWKDSFIRMKPDAPWMKLQTRQFDGSRPPFRIAYMRAKLMGFIPFEGRDLLHPDGASMWGRMGGLKNVFDVKGPELMQSALLTWLAEVLLMPAVLSDPMLSWKSLDNSSVEVTLSYQGIEAKGRFFFSTEGFAVGFSTGDRYYLKPDGSVEKIPWKVYFTDYLPGAYGFLFPSSVRASWLMKEGEYEYWKGSIASIKPLILS